MADKNTYIDGLRGFASGPAAKSPSWVREIRSSGVERFAEQGFPTTKSEEWRFTRVRPLLQHDFHVREEASPNGLPADRASGLAFDDSGFHRLVFVDGHFAEHLSSTAHPDGLDIRSLRGALESNDPMVRKHVDKHAAADTNPFVALNSGYLFDGAVVHVARGVFVDKPIHLLFVSTSNGKGVMSQPRNLIVAEELARATVVESYVGVGKDVYFTNAVTEAVLAQGAHIDHYKVQKESLAAYHVGSLHAHMERDARFRTQYVSMGGALVRNDVATVLDGEGVDCRLDGLYIASGHQHMDSHTNIEHAKPHCESHELYKGILAGRARGVFNGKIHVHPDAQKTDAKQSNGCMLLSEDAQINTNPQLEIYADDVKCTHGAFVGQIDEKAVFYLRSRGLKGTEARHMLVQAFANEVLERIDVGPLRDRLGTDLVTWLSGTRIETGLPGKGA
jgi:Fe-S cluster assembly protein SufD